MTEQEQHLARYMSLCREVRNNSLTPLLDTVQELGKASCWRISACRLSAFL